MKTLRLFFDLRELPVDLRGAVASWKDCINQVQVFDICKQDIGLSLNDPRRPAYFQPGEWTQTTCKMTYYDKIMHVWFFKDSREQLYKLAFDACPKEFGLLPFLSQDGAVRKMVLTVLEFVGQPLG